MEEKKIKRNMYEKNLNSLIKENIEITKEKFLTETIKIQREKIYLLNEKNIELVFEKIRKLIKEMTVILKENEKIVTEMTLCLEKNSKITETVNNFLTNMLIILNE